MSRIRVPIPVSSYQYAISHFISHHRKNCIFFFFQLCCPWRLSDWVVAPTSRLVGLNCTAVLSVSYVYLQANRNDSLFQKQLVTSAGLASHPGLLDSQPLISGMAVTIYRICSLKNDVGCYRNLVQASFRHSFSQGE